jgi:hypothetical protein
MDIDPNKTHSKKLLIDSGCAYNLNQRKEMFTGTTV